MTNFVTATASIYENDLLKKEKKLFSNKASARFQDSVHIRHNNRVKGFNSHNFNNCSKQKDTVKSILVLIVIFCISLLIPSEFKSVIQLVQTLKMVSGIKINVTQITG